MARQQCSDICTAYSCRCFLILLALFCPSLGLVVWIFMNNEVMEECPEIIQIRGRKHTGCLPVREGDYRCDNCVCLSYDNTGTYLGDYYSSDYYCDGSTLQTEWLFLVEVLILVTFISGTCLLCFLRILCELLCESQSSPRADDPYPELRQFREQLQNTPQQNTTTVTRTQLSAPIEAVTSESSVGMGDVREEVIKRCLFHRTLEHGDSARNLSIILAAANSKRLEEKESDEGGNLFSRSWRSIEASIHNRLSSRRNNKLKDCSICLKPFDSNETVSWAKNDDCDHVYHQKCILRWMRAHDNCPMCRTNLLGYDEVVYE